MCLVVEIPYLVWEANLGEQILSTKLLRADQSADVGLLTKAYYL